jgi:hypothetical protein
VEKWHSTGLSRRSDEAGFRTESREELQTPQTNVRKRLRLKPYKLKAARRVVAGNKHLRSQCAAHTCAQTSEKSNI